jgi:hypothetical protein
MGEETTECSASISLHRVTRRSIRNLKNNTGAVMTDIRISAASTKLSGIVAGPAASGSAAQQVYDRAVKRLTEAQKQLAQDAVNKAPEETLKVDEALVEMAAAAVAAAAAALAREQDRSQGTRALPSAAPETERTPDQRRKGEVDVYA